jgi:C-terminal processing protease CtpA/Prc
MNPTHLQRIAKALGGIPIWSTCEGSVAREAGLRFGDIILAVNGQPTPTVDAYFEAKGSSSETMTITYFRGGSMHDVVVSFRKVHAPTPRAGVEHFVSSRAAALVEQLENRTRN